MDKALLSDEAIDFIKFVVDNIKQTKVYQEMYPN
jgi:hypothetical protein